MSQHIVTAFEKDLVMLWEQIIFMSKKTLKQVNDSIALCKQYNAQLAQELIQQDKMIDQLMIDLENQATRILALRQPLAKDLRRVVVSIRLAIDIERIGDMAKNVAKRMVHIQPSLYNFIEPDLLDKLFRLIQTSFDQIIAITHNEDSDLAKKLWTEDDAIDAIYHECFKSTLLMNHDNINVTSQIIFVLKNFERIGDHFTNICENIFYLSKGIDLN